MEFGLYLYMFIQHIVYNCLAFTILHYKLRNIQIGQEVLMNFL